MAIGDGVRSGDRAEPSGFSAIGPSGAVVLCGEGLEAMEAPRSVDDDATSSGRTGAFGP